MIRVEFKGIKFALVVPEGFPDVEGSQGNGYSAGSPSFSSSFMPKYGNVQVDLGFSS